MLNKKELQEENTVLIKENEGYIRDISMLEREKLRLMEKCDKYTQELINEESECRKNKEMNKIANDEIRELKNKLSKLINVEKVLERLEESLKLPSKVFEDKNRELTERVQQLEYENRSLRSNIDTFNQSMHNTGYLEGKIEAYERMLIPTRPVAADDGFITNE